MSKRVRTSRRLDAAGDRMDPTSDDALRGGEPHLDTRPMQYGVKLPKIPPDVNALFARITGIKKRRPPLIRP